MIVRDVDVLPGRAARADVGVTSRSRRSTARSGGVPSRDRAAAPASARPSDAVDAGIDASVGMAPILPGLSDDRSQMADVVRAARDAGATSIWTNVLYLRPGTREHFLDEPRPRLAGAAAALRAPLRGSGIPSQGRRRAGQARGCAAPGTVRDRRSPRTSRRRRSVLTKPGHRPDGASADGPEAFQRSPAPGRTARGIIAGSDTVDVRTGPPVPSTRTGTTGRGRRDRGRLPRRGRR